MTGRARSRGPENKSVVLAEGADLGIELGIKPVGLLYGRLKVIEDKPPWYSAEVTEGIFNAAKELVGGLAIDSLAVGLARVRQHDAEDMSSMALAVGCDDWSAGTEVNLSLIAGLTFEPTKWKLLNRPEAMDKATDGVVAALEAVFGGEILINALGAQTQITLGLDDVLPGFAFTRATAGLIPVMGA